jgi:hypothetical protein
VAKFETIVAPTKAGEELAKFAQDPRTLFSALAKKLGGAAALGRFLNCSRATAYNLLQGRRRWSPEYVHKALTALSKAPVVPVTALCKAGFEIPEEDWRPHRPQSLVLDCDGAFIVKGNSMWPLVADGQYVLYKEVSPGDLRPGDVVLARLKSGETLIKAWYPVEGKENEVYLASLYRGPDVYRKDLYRPFQMDQFTQLRRVVGIWLG